MKLHVLATIALFVTPFVGANTSHAAAKSSTSENVYKFACGNKTLSLYESSEVMFVDKTKADSLDILSVTSGAIANFRLYAEMGGSYTQYQLSIFDGSAKLSSQWLTADGDPRRAADVVSCSIMDPVKGKAPRTKSTLEKIRAGELD